ncbi:MAG: insulinase family protein [Cyclobacteriaceae bacterium]|nr:insulinase family protein [Cyclobacteriaceae bacterium]MDH4294794.1 insulinase family protein [Cyclobacteriaceae bacterium]MDH5249243.1 insulinase family protein [Cyclobacteriaceae bacterium]
MKSSILKIAFLAIIPFSFGFTLHAQDGIPSEFSVDGMKVILKPSIKEIISVRLFIKGGTANYPKALEGVEALALEMVTEGGTKNQTRTEFASALEKIGTSLASSSSLDYSEISLSCVKSFWDPSWKLFAEAITSPRFDEKEFSIIKGRVISQAKQAESNPDQYLQNRALQNAFGSRNYSKIPAGTVQSLENISLQQVVAHYNTILGKQNIFLVVVGNVTETDIKQKVAAAFATLGPGKIAKPEPSVEFTPAVNIEDRDIATNYIRGTMNAPGVNEKDGVPMMLAMNILRFRFFVELRTKRSLSYAPGAFYATAAIKNPYAVYYISTTDPKQSLQVMIDEINKVKNEGFSEKELKDMKETYLTNHFLGLETNDSQTMSLGLAEVAGDWRNTESFMTKVDHATIKDINDAFNKYSSSINWTYLGKEDAVSDADFKQPQMLPAAEKVLPNK